jgi:hypothetical protein
VELAEMCYDGAERDPGDELTPEDFGAGGEEEEQT